MEIPNSDEALLSLYKNEDYSNFSYWICHVYLYNMYSLRLLAKQREIGVLSLCTKCNVIL